MLIISAYILKNTYAKKSIAQDLSYYNILLIISFIKTSIYQFWY